MRYYFDRSQTPRLHPNGARVFYTPMPFASIARAENVPCPDGKRRTFSASGEPDTYFSLPGSVRVSGRTVTGSLAFHSGLDRAEGPEFHANAYGRNGNLLPRREEPAHAR